MPQQIQINDEYQLISKKEDTSVIEQASDITIGVSPNHFDDQENNTQMMVSNLNNIFSESGPVEKHFKTPSVT